MDTSIGNSFTGKIPKIPDNHPSFQKTNDHEINKIFRHFKYVPLPIEDDIIDIWYSDKIGFNFDTYDLVHNLYFITKKGFYFKSSDIIKDNSNFYRYEKIDCCETDFGFYLDSLFRVCCAQAYYDSLNSVLRFLYNNLRRFTIHFNFTGTYPNKDYYFRILGEGYSYIR